MDATLKRERSRRKTLTQQEVFKIVQESQLPIYLGMFGAIYLAKTVKWSDDEGARNAMAALFSACAILVGLGKAGVGDQTTKEVALAVGLAELFGGFSKSTQEAILAGAAGGTILGILSGLLPALAA